MTFLARGTGLGMALILAALVALFFITTIVRLGGSVAQRAM